jgi:hypothetical protein
MIQTLLSTPVLTSNTSVPCVDFRWQKCCKRRRGFALLEIMVAATLVMTGIAVIAKLSVASGRMWMQTRHERLAMEELSNQLEFLMSLAPSDRESAMTDLSPSDHVAESLSNATLIAKPIRDIDGSRIELTVQWGDKSEPSKDDEAVLQGRLRRMSLVAWIDPLDVTGSQQETAQ